jgi:hypothetical protein
VLLAELIEGLGNQLAQVPELLVLLGGEKREKTAQAFLGWHSFLAISVFVDPAA